MASLFGSDNSSGRSGVRRDGASVAFDGLTRAISYELDKLGNSRFKTRRDGTTIITAGWRHIDYTKLDKCASNISLNGVTLDYAICLREEEGLCIEWYLNESDPKFLTDEKLLGIWTPDHEDKFKTTNSEDNRMIKQVYLICAHEPSLDDILDTLRPTYSPALPKGFTVFKQPGKNTYRMNLFFDKVHSQTLHALAVHPDVSDIHIYKRYLYIEIKQSKHKAFGKAQRRSFIADTLGWF